MCICACEMLEGKMLRHGLSLEAEVLTISDGASCLVLGSMV